MNLNLFTELGLTRNEAIVYTALVEQGKASAQVVSKRIKLPRTTVYSVLNTLDEKNLVRKEEIRGVTFFRIDNPSGLLQLAELEEKRAQHKKQTALNLVQELKPLFQTGSYRVPKTEFFEGRAKVERFLYANLEIWTESILQHDGSTWGYQDDTFVQHFSAWLKKAWKVIHVEKRIAGRILSNRGEIERQLRGNVKGREVRVLSGMIFKSSIWVMGDYVIVVMTRSMPVYAFQIHEPLLAEGLRNIFCFLYEHASAEV